MKKYGYPNCPTPLNQFFSKGRGDGYTWGSWIVNECMKMQLIGEDEPC